MAKKQTPKKKNPIIEQLRKSPHQKVKVAITDIDGVLRGKYLHKDKFLSATESGFGFCNVVFGWDSADVCYDNGKFTGWHSGYPDALVQVDLDTFREVPWDGGVPFFLGDFAQPRNLPARSLEKRSRARQKDGLQGCLRNGIRVVQLQRNSAITRREEIRRDGAIDSRDVRLFGDPHRAQSAVFLGDHERASGFPYPDRRTAHGDGSREFLKPRSFIQRRSKPLTARRSSRLP